LQATDAFFGLHRHEVLLTPRYARLQIGTVKGQKELIKPPVFGAISQVPYAEPNWLTKGYHSAYFTDKHRKFQAWLRKIVEEHLIPDAHIHEEDGKFPSPHTVEIQVLVSHALSSLFNLNRCTDLFRKYNLLAMRMGPGTHLKGLTLAEGLVKPEEV
jgi:hypothetical protein